MYKYMKLLNRAASLLLMLLLVVPMSLVPSVASAVVVVPTTIFSDSFESGDFSNWTSSDTNWSVTSGSGHQGNKKAQISGQGTSDDVLLKSVSTLGYKNISVSYYYRAGQDIESTDHIYFKWWNGSSWQQLADHKSLSVGGWVIASYILPAGANNRADFKIQFVAHGLEPSSGNGDHDEFQLDDVSITGEAIPVDGGWTSWSTKSAQCGITATQTRTCTNPTPTNGGKDCSLLDDGNNTQPYTNSPCPTDGGWSVLGSCPTEPGSQASTLTSTCINPAPANGGKDCDGQAPQFSCQAIPPTPLTCNPEASMDVFSDHLTLKGTSETVPVSFHHSAWTALISGATWIWGEDPIVDPVHQTSETFTRTFTVSGTPLGATLDIAADNTYEVSVNGHLINTDTNIDNFSSADTFTISASDLISGSNTITFVVTNVPLPTDPETATPQTNPAGLLYKLTVKSNMCPGTIKITKYECPADTTILRSLNGPSETDINNNTYAVPNDCKLQKDATFGYTYDATNITNNTGTYLGLFGDTTPFTPFALTDINGVTKLNNAPTPGRYIVAELGSDGKQLPKDDMLGLYCFGDGDVSPTNDNQEITFSVAGKVSNCVAYNKMKIVPPPAPKTLRVHIYKYLKDGNNTTQIPNESTLAPFPMVATWSATNIGAGTGNYILGNSHGQSLLKYAADTSDMTSPADYTTSEVTDVSSNFLPIGAECSPGKFRLVGYKDGNTLSEAENATLSSTAPVYNGLTADKYEIVVNEKCPEVIIPPVCDTESSLVGDICVINPVDVCLNITGVQTEIPDDMVKNDAGNCVAKEVEHKNENGGGDNNPPQVVQRTGGGNGPMSTFRPSNGLVLGASTSKGEVLGDSCTPYINTYMRMGRKNNMDEVKNLQTFLNEYMGLNLPVTGFFGLMTKNAVDKFQIKENTEVLTPWVKAGLHKNDKEPTGYVYKTTQRRINLIKCNSLSIPVPQLP